MVDLTFRCEQYLGRSLFSCLIDRYMLFTSSPHRGFVSVCERSLELLVKYYYEFFQIFPNFADHCRLYCMNRKALAQQIVLPAL